MSEQTFILSENKSNAITRLVSGYLISPIDAKDRLHVVASNMALLRRKAGLSQKDVCEVIGCAPQTYSGYEKGKHEPSLETLVRLAHLYDVTLDYLMGKHIHDAEETAVEEVGNISENVRLLELVNVLAEKVDRLEKQRT